MKSKSENLQKRSFEFARQTMQLVRENKLDFVDSVISKQLIRAATSVGANITEAQSALSKKGFANSYRIALRSANESNFWLKLLLDSNSSDKIRVNGLLSESTELSKIIASIILKVI